MRETFELNLPWFVNGTLDAAEAAEMQRYLEENPEAAKQLAAYREFSGAVSEEWQTSPEDLPAFARLSDRIRAGQRHPASTWWQRLAGWFGGGSFFPRLAGAAAVVTIAVQAALLSVLHQDLARIEEREAQFRSTAGVAEVGPFIRVSFRPEAREMDTRMLLIGLGASYVGGPSQLGDYYVFVNREQADQAINHLRASHLVESVDLVAKVPKLD